MSEKYFIALTGAKKNIGDFLITERSLKLLKYIAPEYKYEVKPHWDLLDDISFVNNSEGIIILGGPGYQMNMYPGVYKLRENLNEIEVPIFILGSGWKGVPGDEITEKLYVFNKTTIEFLDKIESLNGAMGCRDYQTQRVLENHGYKNVSMTGCPVWYDLESLNKPFIPREEINRIIYTPAQNKYFYEQSIDVLKFLRKKYKNAEITVGFHRGIGVVDEFTPVWDAQNTQRFADEALKMNIKSVDVSYDLDNINFYEDCDIHIGYRVHAHIYFLSKRLPSILLHEDGRGNGVTEALGSPGINGYKKSKVYSKIFQIFNQNRRMLNYYKKIAFKLNKHIVQDLSKTLKNLEKDNFSVFKNVTTHIDEHYQEMERFIKNITK